MSSRNETMNIKCVYYSNDVLRYWSQLYSIFVADCINSLLTQQIHCKPNIAYPQYKEKIGWIKVPVFCLWITCCLNIVLSLKEEEVTCCFCIHFSTIKYNSYDPYLIFGRTDKVSCQVAIAIRDTLLLCAKFFVLYYPCLKDSILSYQQVYL